MTATAEAWISVLRETHDRLFTYVGSLAPDDLRRGSYCSDWNVAQVLSHIGSGAEIGRATLIEALGGGGSFDQERREAIWARWNAKSPDEQAADAAVADDGLVAEWEGIGPDLLASLRLPFVAGTEATAAEMLSLQVGERALHSWDVFVTFEPDSLLAPREVELLVDSVQRTVPWFARAAQWTGPEVLAVHAVQPEREFTLRVGETASLEVGSPSEGASASLPAEAFVRLVYGRLDAAHTPSTVDTTGVGLDQLRTLFPGF